MLWLSSRVALWSIKGFQCVVIKGVPLTGKKLPAEIGRKEDRMKEFKNERKKSRRRRRRKRNNNKNKKEKEKEKEQEKEKSM